MRINFAAIEKFLGEVKQNPDAAIKVKRVDGDCNFSDGEPHFSATLEFAKGATTIACDNPPFMGGGGTAPDPILYCLYGTASCFAGTMMLIIAQRGLQVDSLKVTVQNKVNLTKPLGLGDVPIVERVWITMEYTGSATEQEMRDVTDEAMDTCPGAYCITNPIPLTAEIKKAK